MPGSQIILLEANNSYFVIFIFPNSFFMEQSVQVSLRGIQHAGIPVTDIRQCLNGITNIRHPSMDNKEQLIDFLFDFSPDIRYVALYLDNELVMRERQIMSDSSSLNTDKFEELLVNPTLLTLTRQRGNIDCGGLRFIIIAYGNFFQVVREINKGHLSICLSKTADLTTLSERIFETLRKKYHNLF